MCLKAKISKKLGGKREENGDLLFLNILKRLPPMLCWGVETEEWRGHGRIWSGRMGFRVDPICSLFLIFIFVFRG